MTDPDPIAPATPATGEPRQRRIFIIGGPGSGKTWLAQRIGSALGLAVHHLDEVARVGGGNGPERSPAERLASVDAILLEQGWVAEGVHIEWTDRLVHGADLIIWLDHVSAGQAARRIVLRFVRTALAEVRRRPGLSKVDRFGDYIRNLHQLVAAVPESRRYYQSDTRDVVAGNRAGTAMRLRAYRSKVVHCRTVDDIDDVVSRLLVASRTESWEQQPSGRHVADAGSLGRRGQAAPLDWPNLFVVGAAKAGTTSLWSYLDHHPQVAMSPNKEPHFFSRIRPDRRLVMFFPHVSDEATYRQLFAGVDDGVVYRGEASTSYLWDPEAAGRIKAVSPDAHIVAILRDPVARAYSHYLNDAAEGIEQRSFEAAVRMELSRSRPGRWGASSVYLEAGLYCEALKRYLDLFPSRVHVLFFEEFVADIRGEMDALYRALGLDPAPAFTLAIEPQNPYKRSRNRLAATILSAFQLRLLGRRLVPAALHPAARALLVRPGEKPTMSSEARSLLTDYYRADADRAARLLGRSHPWTTLKG